MGDTISAQRKKYDAMAKELLAHKEVIANILKYAVRDFKGYSVPEIITFLSGEPEIGVEYVDDSITSKIDAAGSESVSINEGARTFDIKFKVNVPGKNESADLIINIEAQTDFSPGYTLEKRGIYYLSRLISSQYDVEFKGSDFNKLKKVYSIWICLNPSKEYQNTIAEYCFEQSRIIGEPPDDKTRYDLMSLIMVNLGSKDKNYDGLIKMLDYLLKEVMVDKVKALQALEKEFHIPIISVNKEVDDMCNLSSGIYRKGIDEGIEQGIEKGIEQGIEKGIEQGIEKGLEQGIIKGKIEVVDSLLADGFSLERALEIVKISQEAYAQYKASLTEK
jgi:predicted transposase/invertase (TIGR01784 family)